MYEVSSFLNSFTPHPSRLPPHPLLHLAPARLKVKVNFEIYIGKAFSAPLC